MISFLVPLLGQLTAFFLVLSPLPQVLRDRKAGRLATDPTPFPIALINALMWVLLAAVFEDPWIFAPNFVGVCSAAFTTASSLRFCRDDAQLQKVELLLTLGLGLIGMAAMVTTPVFFSDLNVREQIIGNLAMGIVVVMYGSPCMEALNAIRFGDASRLNLALALAGVANGTLWGYYGLAIGVMQIGIPNGLGACLSLLNVAVKLWFRSKAANYGVAYQPMKPLQQAIEHDRQVVVRSVATARLLHMWEYEISMEIEHMQAGIQVGSSADTGTPLRVVKMSRDNVAFQLADNRFLRICPGSPTMPGISSFQPSPFSVAAVPSSDGHPGEEGLFLPVYGDAIATDPVVLGSASQHNYKVENVGFWNPLHRVFLRVNEAGAVDCSPPVNAVAGEVKMPAGWDWERFTVQLIDDTSCDGINSGLRPQAHIFGTDVK